jgi:hypothetical protein
MNKTNLSKVAWGAASSLALAFSLMTLPTTSADTLPATDNPVPATVALPATPTAEEAPAAIAQGTRLNNLVARGQQEISKRVQSLGSLESKIQSSKLSDTQKSTLTPLIDTNVAGLKTLSDQIGAGTDVTAVKALDQKVYTDFRIYAVVIPQINEARSLYGERNSADSFITVTLPKIQAKLDAAKAKGKDVSARQTAVDNAKTTLASIQADIDGQVTKALGVKPSDYPATSKTDLGAVRSEIKSIHDQMKGVWNSLKTAK